MGAWGPQDTIIIDGFNVAIGDTSCTGIAGAELCLKKRLLACLDLNGVSWRLWTVVTVDCGLNHSAMTGEILDPGPGVIIPGGPPWGVESEVVPGEEGEEQGKNQSKAKKTWTRRWMFI